MPVWDLSKTGPYDYAHADVSMRVHRIVPPFSLGPQSLMRPHWAANWIRWTETIDNHQDATRGTELQLNRTIKELTFLFFSLSVSPTSPLASNSHQKGEDFSKQCLPVLAAAGKTQRHYPRLWNQILRKGLCMKCSMLMLYLVCLWVKQHQKLYV